MPVAQPDPTLGLYSETAPWQTNSAAAVPTVPPVNIQPPQLSQNQTIGSNLQNANRIYQLATSTGAASGAGQAANLNTALPGAQKALGSELTLGESNLSGQIDPATWNNIEDMAAQRGVEIGSPGSPNANAALLAALGETTQQLETLGGQEISSAVGQAPTGPAFNPASQQLTPQDALNQAEQQAGLNQQTASQNAALQAAQAGLKAGGGATITSGGPAPTSTTDSEMGLGISPYTGLISGTGSTAAAGSLAGAFNMTDNGDGTMTDEYGTVYNASTGVPVSAPASDYGYQQPADQTASADDYSYADDYSE